MLNVKKTSFKLSRSRRIALIIVSLVAILCGVSAAVSLAREQIAYVAGYAAFALLLLSIPFVIAPALIGIGLSVPRRTRWMGFVSLIWASLLITSFYITFKVLDSFGQVSYKHEKMVSIGPDVQANLVIYFNSDATHDEIQNFWEETLSTRQAHGSCPRPGVSGLLALFPLQGHEGVSVSFFLEATASQREDVKSRVNASPIVYKVLENVSPADIKKID